jgi:hypothetical protein
VYWIIDRYRFGRSVIDDQQGKGRVIGYFDNFECADQLRKRDPIIEYGNNYGYTQRSLSSRCIGAMKQSKNASVVSNATSSYHPPGQDSIKSTVA